MVMVLFALLNGLGYLITSFIYRFTGNPPEALSHMLSGLAAIAFFSFISLIFQFIMKHSNVSERHRAVHNQLMDALDQISKGNFNVLIDKNQHHYHEELINAINDMAKNLGTMETMRQDFISNVSHEIQSPLTSISGFATLLKDDKLTDEQRVHYATIIEMESKRLSSLSDNLLKLSLLDSDKKPLTIVKYRLDKQIEAIILSMEPQWSAKNQIPEVELEKCLLEGDQDLLSQVWVNLLHNSIKFTPQQGSIYISLTQDADNVFVKITDTGIGIAQEEQVHIFERFYKVDKSRDRSLGGNGLGLSLVYKIIQLHDGKITVDSEINEGTTFLITLPIRES